MEIKINKEIRTYKETVYFGLTARQLICSLLAVGAAAGLYQHVIDYCANENELMEYFLQNYFTE